MSGIAGTKQRVPAGPVIARYTRIMPGRDRSRMNTLRQPDEAVELHVRIAEHAWGRRQAVDVILYERPHYRAFEFLLEVDDVERYAGRAATARASWMSSIEQQRPAPEVSSTEPAASLVPELHREPDDIESCVPSA